MTHPNNGFNKAAPKQRAWTGVGALVVGGFVIVGALLLWGRGELIGRLVMGEDVLTPSLLMLSLLFATSALTLLAGLCAALTVQKPGAAFVGYTMSLILSYAFNGVLDLRVLVEVVAVGAVMEAVFFGYKYARFDIYSGILAGFAGAIARGLAGFIAIGFEVDYFPTQFISVLFQLVIAVVVVVPLAYGIAKAVRPVLRQQ